MMKNFAVERRQNIAYVHGLSDAEHDIINYGERNGDIILLVRRKGEKAWHSVGQQAYYPTVYFVVRLVPIDPEKATRGGKKKMMLYSEMPRVKRKDFKGWYYIAEVYVRFTPGRRRSIVKQFAQQLDVFCTGVAVDWTKYKPEDIHPTEVL